ncbi:hypothetical protein H0H93_008176 [Arthromyces matolae]|nr:hypothetical protein H0H93_008176 [Arthromyces matolae]
MLDYTSSQLSSMVKSSVMVKLKSKVGLDGLTKHQRYYQSHPEVRIKNCARERLRREQAREMRLLQIARRNGSSESGPVVPSSDLSNVEPRSSVPSNVGRPQVHRHADDALPAYLPADFLDQRTKVWPIRDRMNDTALEKLVEMRERIMQWSRGWGGVDFWTVQLDYSYQTALKEEGPLTPRWRESMFYHARVGREMLANLRQYDHNLPEQLSMQEEIWRLRVDLAQILVKGITVLEIKTSILPGVCNVDHCCQFDDEESAQATEPEDSDSDADYSDGSDGDLDGDDGADEDYDGDGVQADGEHDGGFASDGSMDAEGETDNEV